MVDGLVVEYSVIHGRIQIALGMVHRAREMDCGAECALGRNIRAPCQHQHPVNRQPGYSGIGYGLITRRQLRVSTNSNLRAREIGIDSVGHRPPVRSCGASEIAVILPFDLQPAAGGVGGNVSRHKFRCSTLVRLQIAGYIGIPLQYAGRIRAPILHHAELRQV